MRVSPAKLGVMSTDIQQIMLHMSETGAYTQEMLEPFSERLANLKEIMKRDSADGKHPEPIVRLMSKKLEGVGMLPPPSRIVSY